MHSCLFNFLTTHRKKPKQISSVNKMNIDSNNDDANCCKAKKLLIAEEYSDIEEVNYVYF